MKILLLNGNRQGDNLRLDEYAEQLHRNLESQGHDARTIKIAALQIKACTGCWHCWVKTPGLCSTRDAMPQLLESYMASDVVLHITPLWAGFVSAHTKKALDKMIPLIHPYISVAQNESIHTPRYAKYPAIGAIVQLPNETDEEDYYIAKDYFERVARQFHSDYLFTYTIQNPQTTILHEIGNI